MKPPEEPESYMAHNLEPHGWDHEARRNFDLAIQQERREIRTAREARAGHRKSLSLWERSLDGPHTPPKERLSPHARGVQSWQEREALQRALSEGNDIAHD